MNSNYAIMLSLSFMNNVLDIITIVFPVAIFELVSEDLEKSKIYILNQLMISNGEFCPFAGLFLHTYLCRKVVLVSLKHCKNLQYYY